MMRDLFIREIEKFGADAELADRLLIHGDTPYLIWLSRRLTDPKKDVYGALQMIAEITGKSITQVKYAYFSGGSTPLYELRKIDQYPALVSVLMEAFPDVAFWESILPYAFLGVRRFAIEVMLARGARATEISGVLGVSVMLVYKVRKAFLVRFIQQKGDVG